MAGDEDHRQIELSASHLAQELEAVGTRHLEITDHQPSSIPLLEEFEGLVGLIECPDCESGFFQGDRHGLSRAGLVVDHQDQGCFGHCAVIVA